MKKFDLATDTEFVKVGEYYMNKLSNGKLYTKEQYKELMRKALEDTGEVKDDTKQEASKPTKRNNKRK